MRSGAQTLVLLATPLTAAILRKLRDGPQQQATLRKETGHPAQTTLRAQVKKLCDAGAIEKWRRNRFPGVLEYELTEAGDGLVSVGATLERWLAQGPHGPLELGGHSAKAAIRAITEAWSATMLRALAAKPLTLTELDSVITALNYPSLERRLSAMRLVGLVEACNGSAGRGTPYGVTDWARRSIAPLVTAARWERQHAPAETAPIVKLDVETAFLLAAALLPAPSDLSGSCRLAVDLRTKRRPALAGIVIALRDGSVSYGTTRLDTEVDAWASGGLQAWFAAMVDGDPAGLELGGDAALARSTVECLHVAVFDLALLD